MRVPIDEQGSLQTIIRPNQLNSGGLFRVGHLLDVVDMQRVDERVILFGEVEGVQITCLPIVLETTPNAWEGEGPCTTTL